jgi:hypothetical protein
VEDLGPWCKNCGHSFKMHEQSTLNVWFCDKMNEFGEFCTCNCFESKRSSGTQDDPIEVQYDSESYKWN